MRQLIIIITFYFLVPIVKVRGQITLKYPEFDLSFYPTKCTDTLHFNDVMNKKGVLLILYLENCSGTCKFELFNASNRIMQKGAFTGICDTLSEYSFAKMRGITSGVTNYSVRKLKYFYPLKTGQWSYYDNNEFLRKDEYHFEIK